jgi:uncharacterized integral membrane protein
MKKNFIFTEKSRHLIIPEACLKSICFKEQNCYYVFSVKIHPQISWIAKCDDLVKSYKSLFTNGLSFRC